ncbi:hypothetical protein DWY11_15575 [Segatella copri]|uniref:Uncharacterized protein n=1 Tax=Segatella copri TaxID=165179 RepID=A0A412H9E6_9BACT|nr:hypothetical protein DWY11_15575 [Segatella copri]
MSKVKCQSIVLYHIYQLQLLSRFQQNIYRIIKMHLDLVINISLPGIQTKQEMIASQLLSALLHQFLMAKAN